MDKVSIWVKENISGILLSVFLGLSAHFLSPYTPWLNSILLGLLFGIVLSNFIAIPRKFDNGVDLVSSKLLEISIIFLAFTINFGEISKIGTVSFVIVVLVMALILMLTITLSKYLKCPGSTGLLVGFGTSICGSSAIAAIAPNISKNNEDVGISVAVVNLFGGLGMLIMPLFINLIGLNDAEQGLIIGGTLHSVGNVAGAGYSVNNAVGDVSITIKLARVAMLSPALIFFSFLINKKEAKNWKQHFNLPYYLWAFIGVTIFVSVFKVPSTFIAQLDNVGKILLPVAMTAIGLKISFKNLYLSGKRAIGFGAIIFVLSTLIYYILIQISNQF